MRAAFAKTLLNLMEKDKRVMLLTADLGFMVFEPFMEKFPDRFINVGAAEQNMMGVATGLSEAGFIPFVYSIVTFASLRAYEFIRNGPAAHALPVRIVGMGGGYEYAHAGPTHHGLEDVGVMRLQPEITTVVPGDSTQIESAIHETYELPRPVYYRLSKDDKAAFVPPNTSFKLGKAHLIRKGDHVLFVTMGPIAIEVLKATEFLDKQGIKCGILLVTSFNPSPNEDLYNEMKKAKLVVSVEAHYTNGGLGSLVCEVAAENKLDCKVVRQGIGSALRDTTGSVSYLNKHFHLDAQSLTERVKKEISKQK